MRAAIDAAVDSPESWPVWPGWDRQPLVRSKGVSDFPYRVVYFVRDDQLMIVAVAHAEASGPATGASVLRRRELAARAARTAAAMPEAAARVLSSAVGHRWA